MCPTEPLKYVDTRFGTKVIMGCLLLSTKSIYKNLFVHPELETWVERQKPQTQDKFRKVSAVVLSDTNFWKEGYADIQATESRMGLTDTHQ